MAVEISRDEFRHRDRCSDDGIGDRADSDRNHAVVLRKDGCDARTSRPRRDRIHRVDCNRSSRRPGAAGLSQMVEATRMRGPRWIKVVLWILGVTGLANGIAMF